MNTVVKWSNISRRSVLIAVMLFIILFLFWWSILPVPLFQDPYATVLFDREGQVMGMKVADDGQMRFEEVQDLPPRYVISVLVFEDRYFLAHQGVNWWALCRALVQNIQAGHVVSGGSTLSMQVVRLALGNPPRTVPEKIREIFLTLRMEQSYSKKQILEMYASHAPFGGNVVGIRAAALKYFNRRPEQLSWAEAALLAVLPNAPALLYPGKNNTLLKQKRDGLLAKLYREGVMSEDSYHLALAEPLPEKKFDIPTVAPHLLAKAYREKKGKVCPTYIDGRLQKKINEIVERHTALLSQNYIYNMAVLVAHVPTGEVRAYVGNSAPRKGSRGNDVDIVQAVRSSGSILKPALYACMLQSGFILPGTLVPDIPSRFGSYSPSNFNRDFKGVVPARQALAQSLNIPFVRLLKDYSYARFYDDLKQLGIRSLNRDADHYGLSLILGGAETSLWDICNLYGGMSAVLNHYNDRDGQYFDGDTDPQLGKFIRFEAQPNDPEALKSLLREQQKKRTPHTQRDFQLHIAALHDRRIEAEARRIVENVKGLGEPDSPEKTHCAVELSPYFVPLATDKDMERLLSMLPYNSLSFSTLEGRHGVYALIDKSERNKEMKQSRPSVRAQLQTEKSPKVPKKTAKTKHHELEV